MASEPKPVIPGSEAPTTILHDSEEGTTAAVNATICFLLVSGRRKTMTFDSDTLTIGRVKELIWNAWDDDWDPNRPSTPPQIRLVFLGKLLQDEDTLRKLKFPTQSPSTEQAPVTSIVHLSIRPFEASATDSDVKKKRRKGTSSSGEEAPDDVQGCCCVVC